MRDDFKMNALLLGGLSKRSNCEWIYEVEKCVKPFFDKVSVVHYDHWKLEGEQPINFPVELEKVVKTVALLDKPYIVIAKSIGSRLALKALSEGMINPVGMFICGLPLSSERESGELLKLLGENKLPTTILQNVDERYIKPDELRKLLEPFENYQVVAGVSGGHSYQAESIAGGLKYFLERFGAISPAQSEK